MSDTVPVPESTIDLQKLRTDVDERGERAIAQARLWADAGAAGNSTGSAALLARVLRDPAGLDFTIGFVDRVVRPEDLRVAARELATLARPAPRFLPWHLRTAVWLGGLLAPVLPGVVVPIARRVLRRMVGHLIIDSRPERLGRAIAAVKRTGVRLNMNLLGEAVLGEREAHDRLEGTRELLERDDVDYVSIKVSAVVSQLSMWAPDETVDRVVERLLPLYRYAAESPLPKFINLDMEEYRDLELTIAVFTRLLDRSELRDLSAGIVLQAYLPDALGALTRLTRWATARVDAGGAPIKVRVVKGANLAMERVDARIHGWPLATVESKQAADANYLRVLDYALRPEHTRAVRIGVAGHNLFTVAYAHVLADERGVGGDVEFEMLLGMAQGQADAVRADVGGLLLYTPVVSPDQFDSAISYLIRRLEENASSDNFMSAAFELGEESMFDRERWRFVAALGDLDAPVPTPNRVQNRADEVAKSIASGFENTPDTDPSTTANRAWIARVLGDTRTTQRGVDTAVAHRVDSMRAVDEIVDRAAGAAPGWRERGLAARADVLREVAAAIERNRGELLAVMAAETGKTLAEGDPEVSEAIDFANYYADRAAELDSVSGARFEPASVTLAAPPWNFPLAIPTGSVLAPLVTGSAVIFKPAPQALRTGAALADILCSAGVPRDVLQLVDVDEGEIGQHLVSHERIEQTILTGSYDTARLFASWRPETRLLGETSGKNSIIVTPSADLDLAVSDVVKSAFGHAGQKCSAASLVILVGSVARSKRFMRQLEDDVRSLHVGYPTDAVSWMGPIIEAPGEKLRRGLTELAAGESWLVEPHQLDASGRLWSPGVRMGVQPGSDFHRTEFFGPILGVMTAETLEQAIALQNAVDYGLTAGLHTLDPNDLALWLERVEAGNLYVNRGITGAIVRRQPFGGWKRSAVGAGAKAGGPNYLARLGQWHRDNADHSTLAADEWLVAAAHSDAEAVGSVFAASDVSNLGLERNVYQYVPASAVVRAAAGASEVDVARVLHAANAAGVVPQLSCADASLAGGLGTRRVAGKPLRIAVAVSEPDEQFVARVVAGEVPSRVRLVGQPRAVLARALGPDSVDVAIFDGDVTVNGRLEMLPFLREQAVSITAHRFGNPDSWSESVL